MFGFKRRKTIPYGMFDASSYGIAAKNARVLERLYHKGHEQAWDGREVLQSLIDTHGAPSLPERERRALGNIFSVILWGELAAWRVSSELADEIEAFEPKLAATGQAFDEARHFYVMHDYLQALDALPERMPQGAQYLLEGVMNASTLAQKLLGMQLMIEPIALTLFHIIKRLDIEPVLTGLMPYYERDEARHVALGVKYLPSMLERMSSIQRASLWVWQARLLTYEIATSRAIAKDLMVLGLDPREFLQVGKAKQLRAMEMTFETLGQDNTFILNAVSRYTDVLGEVFIPDGSTPMARVKNAISMVRHGDRSVADIELEPEIRPEDTPLARGLSAEVAA